MTTHKSFSEEIFQPDFPLDGDHLIEASAGTGKTYNIQNIYARLIMERGVQVARIQVMTYTEAATKELRDRLHKVLVDCRTRILARLGGESLDCQGKDDKEIEMRNARADRLLDCLPDDKLALAKNRLELALLEFDQAAISTIHGFCQRVLARYALETGLKFNQEIQNTKGDDLETLATDWWRTRPQDAPAEITLDDLKAFVSTLSQKAIYDVEPADETTADGYLLARAYEIVQKYEMARPDRDNLNFDDLLRALYDALQGPHGASLAASMREEFQAALIDEFQDTDPVQYAIFKLAFQADKDFPLYFVGDPKQAIYAFRGGDIYTYLGAGASISESRKYALDVNFRSTSKLMEAVNDLFLDPPTAEEGQKSRTFGAEEIAYDTPVRVINEPTIKGKPLDQPFSVISIPDKRNEAVQAVLVELIKETLHERDSEGHQAFAPSDLAVLLNSHTWEPHLQKLLRENGIPSVIVKEGNVFTSPIAVELRLFLLGVANPSDKGSVLGAMATVFSEQKLQEIPALADAPDSLAEQIAAFSEMKRIWETRGFAAMVSKMESSGYQLRLATKADGRRQLADLNQILELAFTAIKQIGKSPDALIDWLTDRINRSMDEKDTPEYSKRLETEGDAVKIMTIHGSKGLQFPVVFLPNCWNLCTDNDHRNKIVIPAYHNANNGHKLTFAFSDTAQTLAQNDQLQEKTRLLYVAMTRAVQRTNVIIPPDSDIDADEPLLRLLQNAKDNFARRQQADPTLVSPIAWLHQNIPQPTGDTRPAPAEGGNWQELACATPRSFANLRPSKGSYSSLSPAVQTYGDDDERDLDLSDRSQQESNSISQHDIFKIPSGATIGTCWHNILEKLPFQTTEQEISTLASEELLCCGFLPSQCLPETALTIQDLTVSMLQKTLDYRLTAPDGAQFSLRDVGWDKRLSEQEFNFSSAKASETTRELAEIISWHWQSDLRKAPFLEAMATWNRLIPQGFLNGFIDLIFQHGDFFYIIDWKSNSLEGKLENFCQEGITREMASHGYFFQYLLYATVLHAYLKQTLGQDYSWERNFGGIRYYFLRGIAANCSAPVFADRPPAALLEDLGRALGISIKA